MVSSTSLFTAETLAHDGNVHSDADNENELHKVKILVVRERRAEQCDVHTVCRVHENRAEDVSDE